MSNPFIFFSSFGTISQSRPEDKELTAKLEAMLAEQEKNEQRRERPKEQRQDSHSRHECEHVIPGDSVEPGTQ